MKPIYLLLLSILASGCHRTNDLPPDRAKRLDFLKKLSGRHSWSVTVSTFGPGYSYPSDTTYNSPDTSFSIVAIDDSNITIATTTLKLNSVSDSTYSFVDNYHYAHDTWFAAFNYLNGSVLYASSSNSLHGYGGSTTYNMR